MHPCSLDLRLKMFRQIFQEEGFNLFPGNKDAGKIIAFIVKTDAFPIFKA